MHLNLIFSIKNAIIFYYKQLILQILMVLAFIIKKYVKKHLTEYHSALAE